MFRARVTIPKAEDIEIQIAFSEPLKEWRELMRQLGQAWPSWQFGGMIAKAISKGSTTIDVSDEELPSP